MRAKRLQWIVFLLVITGLALILYSMPSHAETVANPVAVRSSPAPPALQGEQAASQLKEQGLYDSLAESVAATRYALRWEDQPALDGLPPAYRAPNPAQRLTAYFTPTELHLAPLTADRKSESDRQSFKKVEWRATMRLIGYGRGDALLPVGASARLAARDNRIEYHRAGAPLTEWYINKADGLEQGFTIAAPPGAPSADAWLRLALEVTGDLRAEMAEEGQAIALRNGEMALRYGNLYAYDANERELPSRMRVEEGRVILEVDDASAVYPVTIDPLITQQQKLTANTGAAADQFGWSVAISGDTAVVGAPFDDIGSDTDQGAAFVFVRKGTSWNLQQRLTVNYEYVNRFGWSVAISGDTVVVGAPYSNIGYSNQGSAYVFARSGTIWSQQEILYFGNGASNDHFGWSVAISGNTVVVGAFGFNSYQGAAYVYVLNRTSWDLQQSLMADDGEAYDYFGYSVAISGDTIVVGAPGDKYTYAVQGSAYVFARSSNTWGQQQHLTDSLGEFGDSFGSSVAISGNTAIVGAPSDDIGSDSNQGSAIVYVYNDISWNQQQKLSASYGAADDQFGYSVAISGDTAVVGAPYDDIGNGHNIINQGAAYVFARGANSWSQQQGMTSGDGEAHDRFGYSVAISGDTAVVGAPFDKVDSNLDQGSAYVFGAWGEQGRPTANDGAASDAFGYSVAISGNTAVVGAPYDDDAFADKGAAYVFARSNNTWSQKQKLVANDGAAGDYFGASVAISGDTIVVGAPNDDGSYFNQGAAYVFVRSNNTWSQLQKLAPNDGEAADYFGYSVAIAGDTAVVGAYADDNSFSDQGSAYVFTRSNNNFNQQQKLTAGDGAAGDLFGCSVAVSGATIIVGAYGADIGSNTSQGAAYVFFHNVPNWSQQSDRLIASDGNTHDHFGYSVAISGAAVVVGAYSDDNGNNFDQGSAYVFARNGVTWSQQGPKLMAGDGAAGDYFGYSVAISGATVVVGAHYDNVGSHTDRGSAYVFVYDGASWSQQHQLTGSVGAAFDNFGYSVAISGNTVVVGAPNDDIGVNANQGSFYAFVRQ